MTGSSVPSLDLLKEHIDGLLSTDLAVRETVEQKFNAVWLDTFPQLLLPSLCQLMRPEIPAQVRPFFYIIHPT